MKQIFSFSTVGLNSSHDKMCAKDEIEGNSRKIQGAIYIFVID
jgi:hypothetical protein